MLSLTLTAATNQVATTLLITDFLAIHVIRAPQNSTLITYHSADTQATSAETLHDRIYYAGASVYWNKLYTQASDPTFILVAALWYALYAWDQALDVLYVHICALVRRIPLFKQHGA
jgi:hypothetical protein